MLVEKAGIPYFHNLRRLIMVQSTVAWLKEIIRGS
jgi:hypothetical protein